MNERKEHEKKEDICCVLIGMSARCIENFGISSHVHYFIVHPLDVRLCLCVVFMFFFPFFSFTSIFHSENDFIYRDAFHHTRTHDFYAMVALRRNDSFPPEKKRAFFAPKNLIIVVHSVPPSLFVWWS